MFGRTWQHVADLTRLGRAGDVVVTEVASEPIIVVRDRAGELHAFFNVCRHRGGPLALKDEHCDMLICKYHGWTYRLDGMLRGVPHFNRVELFDKRDYGLTPLYYFIFPNLMLNVVPGRLQLNLVVPVAPDHCRVMFRYYYADPDAPGARERLEQDVTFSDRVQQEDAEICERAQQGLRSRAYDRGRFSVRFEEGVYHFQRLAAP